MISLSPCNLCLCHCKQGNVFQAPSMTCMAAAFHRRVIIGCRLMFFEQAREQEEAKWKANNQDSIVSPPLQVAVHTVHTNATPTERAERVLSLQALTIWGGALLELAHFRQGQDAYDMIQQASHAVHLKCTTSHDMLHPWMMAIL